MTTVKKLWIGIAVLTLLTPLGLIIPSLFGAGSAWGEWSLHEIEAILGYMPEGMRRLAERWKPPLPAYSVPGHGGGLSGGSVGYVIAAAIGMVSAAGIGYLLAKLLSRKK